MRTINEKTIKTLLPILSLSITFLLLYLLFIQIERVTTGERGIVILYIFIECMALFFVPFVLNPRLFIQSQRNRSDKKKLKNQKDLQKKLNQQFKYRRVIKFNTHYLPKIVNKCPKCGFENPKNAKMCYNCSRELNF